MLRVVADTNVYVSALVFGGTPREFLERAREGDFDLAVSEDIIAEVAHVLRDRFGWSAGDVGEAYDVIVACTRRVEPTERLTVITEDPDDDRILECAAAARAERAFGVLPLGTVAFDVWSLAPTPRSCVARRRLTGELPSLPGARAAETCEGA